LLCSAGRQAFRQRGLETRAIVPDNVEIAHFEWLGLWLETIEHLNELPPRTEHVSYLLGSLRVSQGSSTAPEFLDVLAVLAELLIGRDVAPHLLLEEVADGFF